MNGLIDRVLGWRMIILIWSEGWMDRGMDGTLGCRVLIHLIWSLVVLNNTQVVNSGPQVVNGWLDCWITLWVS